MSNEKTYRAPDGSIHCIDKNFIHLLPDGCTEIDAETVTEPAQQNQRRWEILSKLAAIDQQSARPARAVAYAIANGNPTDAGDVAQLGALEAQAQSLRAELKALA